MPTKKVVILNGAGTGDDHLASPLSLLTDILDRDHADVTCLHLDQIKLAHCTGCFGCWVKTPGVCVADDPGREIAQTIIQSDILIFFTPVTFGGYSSPLKIMLDRIIPLVLPFFETIHGELHHQTRYARYPRLVAMGFQHHPDETEADLFRTLAGRNALNFHSPSFAAELFRAGEDDDTLTQKMQTVLTRQDPIPTRDDVTRFFPKADTAPGTVPWGGGRNALLIVGSPKVKKRATSGILGEYLLDRLKADGWQTETLTLKASLSREKGQTELCGAVDRSDLIILAFPLYIDALPYLVTKALEIIAGHRKTQGNEKPQRMFALINNGFPESYQNALALAICRTFADRSGIAWAGCLAVGAGEAMGGGQDLTESKRSGPPVNHIIGALDRAGKDLARGKAVSPDTQNRISKSPIPLVSFGIWRWLFAKLGDKWWIQQAKENGIKKEAMYATPYAD